MRDWLNSESLRDEDRRRIGESIRTVEYGWPVGMPTCRPLGAGLWEVRIPLDARAAKVLFCIHDNRLVLLHAFFKQTQSTPDAEITVARRRMRELEQQG